jgi:hypothetical protein
MALRCAGLGLALVALAGAAPAQDAPLLQLVGQPWSEGEVTLHLSGQPGQPTLIVYGLDPLPVPVATAKGPYHVGVLANMFSLGPIPAGGRLDAAFQLPSIAPALAGIPIVMQGFVPGALSNPATLPLDQPHHLPANALVLTAPQPTQQGKFGDQVAVGDLDGDGHKDIAVGAWFESNQGIQFSGRAYVCWGPDFTAITPLSSPNPHPASLFGAGVVAADFDGDGIDDLMVSQEGGFPPFAPPGPGALHFYIGGSNFPTTPSFTRLSQETSTASSPFGRVKAVADFNGDGLPDLAVGLPNAPLAGFAEAGRVRVYWAPDFATNLLLGSPAPQASAHFGTALAAGDVTGDGVPDLVEGSGRADVQGVLDVGAIHVFDGNGLGLVLTIQNPLEHLPQSRFGDAVHVADVDGDGVGEILVADGVDHAFIFWSLSPTDYQVIPKPPAWAVNPFGETAYGVWLGSGDVNADGHVDVLVSDMFEGKLSCSNASSGLVYVALGPYFSTFHAVFDRVPNCDDTFGARFVVADVDVDGIDDLVVGASVADDLGIHNAGHVTLLAHQ